MPELPEVETIKRGLVQFLPNKTIRSVSVFWPKTVGGNPRTFSNQLKNQTVSDISRYGKKIIWHFPSFIMSLHMRMTGQLLFAQPKKKPVPHTRLIFRFKNLGKELHFIDIRKFGRVCIEKPSGADSHGPDAWLAPSDRLVEAIRNRSGRIKTTLLNQTVLAGLGNIYVDEILYKSRIHPERRVSDIPLSRLKDLVIYMKHILGKSIQIGGTSFRDYKDTTGRRGGYKDWLCVYGKEGKPCPCGGRIQRSVVAQRGTHFCPRCQT